MKISHISLIITAIVCAFLCGVFFERAYFRDISSRESNSARVYLEQLKTKVNIKREGTVEIYLNGTLLREDTVLDLKK